MVNWSYMAAMSAESGCLEEVALPVIDEPWVM